MASLGPISKAYVSAVDSMIDTREINKQVTDIYNEEQLTDILNFADRKKTTVQPVYYTFVNESIFKLVDTTGATITNSGTPTVTITGVTAATSGYNRLNDVLILSSTGNKSVFISSVTTSSGQDTLIVKSVDGGNVTITAGDKLGNYSVAVGERSDRPLNLRYGLTKYSNKLQIFRETSQITDVQNASTIEVTINGQPRWMAKDHWEKAILYRGKINATYIGGDMSSTSFSDANPFLVDNNAPTNGGGGMGVQTTRGIDKYVTTYGQVSAAATLGTVVLTDIDAQLDLMTAARAPLQYLVVGGKSARRAYDKLWKGLPSSGAMQSLRLTVDGKEIDTTVERIEYGGYEINLKTLPILDHPVLFANTLISKSMYWIPYNGAVKVEGGGSQPAIQVRYFPNQSPYGNDIDGEIHSGALNPINPTGGIAEFRTDWLSWQGLEVLGAQWFGRQRVLN